MNRLKARSRKTLLISAKKYALVFSLVFLVLTMGACQKYDDHYLRSEYIEDLKTKAGFETLDDLIAWGVVLKSEDLDKILDRDFVAMTLTRLIGEKDCDKTIKDLKDSLDPDAIKTMAALDILGLENGKSYPKKEVTKEEGNAYIDKAVALINDQDFEIKSDYKLKPEVEIVDEYLLDEGFYQFEEDYDICDILMIDEVPYKVSDKKEAGYSLIKADYEEVFEELKFSYSGALDLSQAQIIEDTTFKEVESIYQDDDLKRMASTNRVIEKNGYRISYSLSLNKIHLRVSKKNDQGINVYFDSDIKNIRPSYKWDYSQGVIKDAYLKVDFETSEEVGFSKANYKRLYLDFKDLDYSDLINSVPKAIKPQSAKVETSFELFKIKVPIPQIPFVNFVASVKLNIYVGGHVEIAFNTDHSLGVAIRNNALRIISDHDFSADGLVYALAKTTLGLDFNLEALGFALLDVDTKGGISAKAQATLHLFDTKGKMNTQKLDEDYDFINDVYGDNENVKICGDLSLNWILDVTLNSSETLAHRLGLSKTFHILDEDNQIFGNLSHFENGHFVEKCTAYDLVRLDDDESEKIDVNAIVLEKYSLILKEDAIPLPLKALPEGYEKEDLRYKIEDETIVLLEDGLLKPLNKGATKIRISTSDEKYEVYLNVLVSYGNTGTDK